MYRLGRTHRGRSSPFAVRSNLAVSRYISAYENAIRRSYVTVNPDPVVPAEEELPSVPSGGTDDANLPTGVINVPSEDVSVPPEGIDVPPQVVDVPSEIIKVTNVDLEIYTNTKEHHTDEFDIKDKFCEDDNLGFLIIRRGQKFNLKIGFNRKYDKEKDDLRCVFHFGDNPLPTRGTHAEFILSDIDVPKEWGAYIQSTDSNSISLVVMTPPTCPVGKWRMNIDAVKADDTSTSVFRYVHKDPIYILFNPWCKDDLVFMEQEYLLGEYVLNESGRIYSGSNRSISYKPWDFGQFSGNVLDCIIYLLDISDLKDYARGDPVLVSRKLSAMVNCNDQDRGVLVGNWSDDYSGGTPPLSWGGSIAILEEYYETKKKVCYGQCWVYSGVLTTACRAIGIPARSITNFNSAHDTDGSISIDTFYDSEGDTIDYLNDDSVWNFHCWNDAWMARPDLSSSYGGWQAIDATPQEASDGVFQMGPVPLAAVKSGEVNTPYDGKFAFSEVNGDQVYWKFDEKGEQSVIYIKRSSVGQCISTKKPFSKHDREDITEQYKHADESEEGRKAVKCANLLATGTFYESDVKDVTFEIGAEPNTFIGETIKIVLKITNTSTESRTVNGKILISSMYYTGASFKTLGTSKLDDLVFSSLEAADVIIEIPVGDYANKLKDHCMCKITCMCIVKETKQVFTDAPIFRLRKPHLDIKAAEKVTVGDTMDVEVSFVNPLPVALTDCDLRLEGAHVMRPFIFIQNDIAPYQKFTKKFEVHPKKAGERELIVNFNCPVLLSLTGSHTFTVEKKP